MIPKWVRVVILKAKKETYKTEFFTSGFYSKTGLKSDFKKFSAGFGLSEQSIRENSASNSTSS
ncbi:hypothetical protein CH380_18590 [Leptospira adleri]|nr:hypothetical protein CH380_18590 [Leptospira adleri]